MEVLCSVNVSSNFLIYNNPILLTCHITVDQTVIVSLLIALIYTLSTAGAITRDSFLEALDVDSDDRGRPKKVCSDQMRLQQYVIMFLLNISRFYSAVKNQNPTHSTICQYSIFLINICI